MFWITYGRAWKCCERANAKYNGTSVAALRDFALEDMHHLYDCPSGTAGYPEISHKVVLPGDGMLGNRFHTAASCLLQEVSFILTHNGI